LDDRPIDGYRAQGRAAAVKQTDDAADALNEDLRKPREQGFQAMLDGRVFGKMVFRV
jgi:hypothetical protein